MPILPSLRSWQRDALEKLEACPKRDFLAVATPGAGKTTFALTAVRRALARRRVPRVAVVVPTQHLKHQWAVAAEAFDIHLDPDWSSRDGGLPSDVHGLVLTYQQVASDPDVLRRLFRGAFVVLDEIHHAAEARSWGDGVRRAFETSGLRLALSGTPFRSDQSSIPFVRYDGDLAHADYEYGYGEALAEARVVRPVFFPRIKGLMEWTSAEGSHYRSSFDDPLAGALASQRLRTALSLDGDWLPTVLGQAHHQLEHLRARDPRAAGMVIAMDQDHARGVARLLRERLGVRATLATSDDPDASKKIAAFGESDAPWIVAVRMVSEGVDLPRLRVGVFATNTITELFFRQAVGRLVRWHGRLRRQTAYMFIPDDPRLRAFASGIAEQRRHSLARRERDDEADPFGEGREAGAEGREEQMSLFAVISAVPLGADGKPLDEPRVIDDAAGEEEDAELALARAEESQEDEPFTLAAPEADLAVPPPEPLEAPTTTGPRRRSRRRELREKNSACVRALVRRSGKGHADVNAELNRLAGIERVTEATIKQLERRLALAERWLRRL